MQSPHPGGGHEEGDVKQKRVKVTIGGKLVEGVEVPIEETVERWTDVMLKDGSHLRVKMTVITVIRVDEIPDPQGNPTFSINMAPTIAVIDVPSRPKKDN